MCAQSWLSCWTCKLHPLCTIFSSVTSLALPYFFTLSYKWQDLKKNIYIEHQIYVTSFDVHRAMHRNIISIVKPTRCTNVSNLFYFGMTPYMFRSFHPSSGVRDCTCSNRHLSNCKSGDGYQSLDLQFDKCLLLYVQSRTPDDGRKDRNM